MDSNGNNAAASAVSAAAKSFHFGPMPPAFSPKTVTRTKKALSVAASLAATAVLFRTLARDFHIRSALSSLLSLLSPSRASTSSPASSNLTLVIEQYPNSASHDTPNEIYSASEAYLGSIAPSSARRLRVNKLEAESSLHVTLDSGENVLDNFAGADFKWHLTTHRPDDSPADSPSVRVIELSFERQHKELALKEYLPSVVRKWWEMRAVNRPLKLHMLRYETWYSVDLDHPATFDTIAMDPEHKREVLEDLERFVGSRDYYRRVGKPWRRGYLLYGPPGTGKSSLVAAMANHLKFDIYDLDLAEVTDGSVLRTVLAATTNRSILVVEDADLVSQHVVNGNGDGGGGAAEVHGREALTLDAVLSSIEGLWSSCGDERIVVFTAEAREVIDPAVLRPGRMDVHVHLPYCTPVAFRTLMINYRGISDHPAFPQIERLLGEVEATPEEVAGEIMHGEENVDDALDHLVNFLEEKKGDPVLLVL